MRRTPDRCPAVLPRRLRGLSQGTAPRIPRAVVSASPGATTVAVVRLAAARGVAAARLGHAVPVDAVPVEPGACPGEVSAGASGGRLQLRLAVAVRDPEVLAVRGDRDRRVDVGQAGQPALPLPGGRQPRHAYPPGPALTAVPLDQ